MTMPERDQRPAVMFVHTTPEHPVIAGLSDAAFRLWFDLICYCSRQETNGVVTDPILRKMGKAKVIKELLDAGRLEARGKDWAVHDYLKHNRSAEEIQAVRDSNSMKGEKGAHLRWHVARRVRSKSCDFCLKEVESA